MHIWWVSKQANKQASEHSFQFQYTTFFAMFFSPPDPINKLLHRKKEMQAINATIGVKITSNQYFLSSC